MGECVYVCASGREREARDDHLPIGPTYPCSMLLSEALEHLERR